MDELCKDKVSWVLTSPAGGRLDRMPEIPIGSADTTELPTLIIHPEKRYQRIEGFGGTFNESGWYLLQLLDEPTRESVLHAFFDRSEGAGYSVCATPIAHNDYSLEYYSYNETNGDAQMRDFSIERDTHHLIPYINAARKHGSFILAARPDYPPKWMLNPERRIDPKWYDAFAKYLSCYVTAYEKAGVPISHISLLNEPNIYVEINGDELNTLLRDHVGPVMRADHPEVKLQLCDSASRDHAIEDWGPALGDPATRQYLDSLAYHSYHWEQTSISGIASVAQRYPRIALWQTEVMNLYTRPIHSYADGEVWGKIIADDLEAGASAWLFWNMVVDENGGPWNTDPFNTGYPQDGVAMINQETGEVVFTAKYYYQSHFSRYVLPGSVRLGHSVTQINQPFPENALYWWRIFAFQNTDGTLGLVCINTNEHPASAVVTVEDRQFPISLPGHSIATYLWR